MRRRIGTGPGEWELRLTDCRSGFDDLDEQVDLSFNDPPFNINQPYQGYCDRLSWADYMDFTYQWVWSIYDSLRPGGIMCLHLPDAVVKMVLQRDIIPLNAIDVDWIIWHYRFGQAGNVGASSKCISSKAHCLMYAKPGAPVTWNPQDILVPSDRVAYGDPRTEDSETPGMRVPLDVWGPGDGKYWGRVQGNNKEKVKGCPNQLPEVYLERIIRSRSNPGDLVTDGFSGSGTTGTVAVALGRRFVGCEVTEFAFREGAKRITRGPVRLCTTASGCG